MATASDLFLALDGHHRTKSLADVPACDHGNMGNYLGLWSEPIAEERVIQNHHNDLQQVIISPLHVASKLHQEGVVSRTLVSDVNTLGRSQLQNSTAILSAVTASIHSKPDQFQVFMSVLEDSPESANLARRMRNELSELFKWLELWQELSH